MAEISKITLPSGNTYDLKDAVARQMISGGVSFIIAWDGTSVPQPSKIPLGVFVEYNGTVYTGELDAEDAEPGAFYLVASQTPADETDYFDEYVPVSNPMDLTTKMWEKIGDTQIILTDIVTDVSLSKQTDTVIGTDATFTITQPTVALSAESSTGTGRQKYIQEVSTTKLSGSASGTAVTPSTTYVKATASGGGAAWNSKDQVAAVTGYASPTTDTFVKSVSAETNKNLVTTTVPNVTSAGSASTWSFTMGSGANAETLIISGGNSVAPTLGTAKTVATGATSQTGTGDAVVTGVTVGESAAAVTGLGTPSTKNVIGASATFTNTQPTVALATDSSSGTGKVQVATGISSVTDPSITIAEGSTGDVTVASGGTTKYMAAAASGANIAWNSKDSVTVLKNTTDVSVTKGSV